MSGDPAKPATTTDEASWRSDFDVFRLRLGDAVALVAAFALLFIMAGDWYSTTTGVEAREIVERQGTAEPGAGIFDDGAVEDARVEAEQAERNAWQISSPFDVLVVIVLLATVGVTIAAAALRAAGRASPDPRRSPIALAGYVALVALVFVLFQAALRIDPDSPVTMRIGLPLGVAALGAIAFGAGLAMRQERLAASAEDGAGPGTGARGEPSDRGEEAVSGHAYNRAP